MFKQWILYIICVVNFGQICQADVVLDGSFGRTDVLSGHDLRIDAALGQQVGNNLFHSFQTFNLQSNQVATFTGNAGIKNIISRVTGGQPSNIDGLIRATIPNADMYFINPYGILFGANAKLDVQGDFHASTADYLRLGDGGRFDPRLPHHSVLTVAPVEAFGFLTNTVAPISVSGRGELSKTEWENNSAGLKVMEGKTLSLIGGDLEIKQGTIFKTTVTDGYGEWIDVIRSPLLQAAHGRINLVSVASPGEIMIDNLELARSGIQQLGNISLTEHAFVEVSGVGGGNVLILGNNVLIDKSYIWGKTLGAEDGGKIEILADNNVELLQGGQLVGNTEGTGRGSHLRVTAKNLIRASGYQDVRYSNLSGFFARSGIWITLMGDEIGKSGLIQLEAKDILFENGAVTSASTNTGGDGGDIFIKAQDSLRLEGFDTDVDISNETYRGYWLTSSLVTATYSLSPHAGNAGNIHVEAGRLMMNNPGAVISTTTEGQGRGGNISIQANSISLNNDHPSITGPYIGSDTFSSGDAGKIAISAQEILLKDRSRISGQAHHEGDAGQIAISAQDISLLNHGIIVTDTSSTQLDAGKAGDIKLNTEHLTLRQDSRLSSRGINGNAGTIQVETDTLYLAEESGISSMSLGIGRCGKITIDAKQEAKFDRSAVFTNTESEQSDAGDAGDISLTTDNLLMQNGSQLSSMTFNSGQGGKVVVHANHVLFDGYAQSDDSIYATGLDTSTESLGNAGQIQLTANTLTIKGGAAINSSTRNGGHAGQITVDIAKSIDIYGDIDASLTEQQANNLGPGITSISIGTNAGNAGKLLIRTPVLNLTQRARISTSAQQAQAGTIEIQTDQLHLAEESRISSTAFGIGDGGIITIDAKQEAKFDRSAIFTNTESEQANAGDAGAITLTTDNLLMQNGSQLSSVTFNSGQGGKVTVHANHVLLDGYVQLDDDLIFSAGLDTSTEGTGNAGQIQLTANTLTIKGGAAMSSSTRNGGHAGQITVDVAESIDISGKTDAAFTEPLLNQLGRGITSTSMGMNAGHAGNLLIRTPILNLTDRGQISTSAQQAQAGKITLDIHRLNLQHAKITSEADGDGDAGNIIINAADQLTLMQSNISTQAQHAAGGNISLAINGQVLHLAQGAITTSVKGGMGGGGDINVTRPKFTVLNDSSVIAQADGGNGGNILVSPAHFVSSPMSLVSASSRLGVDGKVVINAPESDVSCGLVSLPTQFLAADNLLKKACRHLTEDELNSSFVVQSKIGTSNMPEDLQNSVYFQ